MILHHSITDAVEEHYLGVISHCLFSFSRKQLLIFTGSICKIIEFQRLESAISYPSKL